MSRHRFAFVASISLLIATVALPAAAQKAALCIQAQPGAYAPNRG